MAYNWQAYGPRKSRVIHEELDGLHDEASALLGKAKAENRKLTFNENSRFNTICDDLAPSLKAELEAARGHEMKVFQYAENKGHEMQRHPSGLIYSNSFSGDQQGPTLPVNGKLPGDVISENYWDDISVVAPKLKAFRNARQAIAGGMALRAIVGREYNRIDNAAEQFCDSHGLRITNAMTEGTGATGGYLVPAPLSQALIDVRDMVGVARKVLDIQPMTSDTLTIPKRAGGLTVYAPGEGNSITTSDATKSQVELICKKRATACQISQELVDDALISVVDNAVSEMGFALANQEDLELINGTGAATTYFGVRGLLNKLGSAGVSQAATGHDTWPELDIADFAAATAKLPGKYMQFSPSWICSSEFYWATMARIAFSAGGVSMAEVVNAAPGMRSFMGFPVYLTEQMPTSTAAATVCCLFGAFSKAGVLGDRTGLRIGRSDDYAFLSDLVTLKATSRYDINIHDSGNSSTAGAYIGLKTAA